MHDIKAIRVDPAGFDEALARRGLPPISENVIALDELRRAKLAQFELYQQTRKIVSKEIGALVKRGELQTDDDSARRFARLSERLENEGPHLKAEIDERKQQLDAVLARIPNLLALEVPPGLDEADNVVLHQHGEPAAFDFPPRQHFELGEALGLMDFAAAAHLSGSRFTILQGALARLERALGTWMLTLHTEQHGYTETAVPLLVNAPAMYGTGQLPKFRADLFETLDGRFLIPTAEVPLTNLLAGAILPEAALPIRLAALTPCFRSEAGSAGRDTRGMLRQHQFAKVELVSITTPDTSAAEHERLTACAERVLTDLGLTWRRVLLCAGDTGFGAAKTHDLEVWLPGQAAWREISSCSTCGDFQARRMAARYRPAGAKGTAFVHTLNGSGVAVGRALIAVMETFQRSDGGITVPEVLRPFMGGTEIIQPPH